MNRTDLNNAKATLTANGWTHSHSITRTPGSKDYGLCFLKDGRKFYLNIETIGLVDLLASTQK